MFKSACPSSYSMRLSPISAACKDVKATSNDLRSETQGRKLVSSAISRYKQQLCSLIKILFLCKSLVIFDNFINLCFEKNFSLFYFFPLSGHLDQNIFLQQGFWFSEAFCLVHYSNFGHFVLTLMLVFCRI